MGVTRGEHCGRVLSESDKGRVLSGSDKGRVLQETCGNVMEENAVGD